VRTVRSGLALGLPAQLVLVTALLAADGIGIAGWLTALGCVAATHGLLARSAVARLGPADRITLVRSTLGAVVAGLVADTFPRTGHVFALAAVSVVALLLDAVDGQVARRTGTASRLGARFDMEVDAFLILVLSVYVARQFGGWVLAIGAARYGYLAAGWVLPWLREPAPPRFWCKVVAALEGIVLTAAAANVLPHWAATAALVVALALLAESFGREAWWLWRQRIRFVPAPARQLVTVATRG
jgi:phosphatidylglycerophosphate synthase